MTKPWHVDENKVKQLPQKLQDWAKDVLHQAEFGEESVHDALCELQERESTKLTNAECTQLMVAMDSYWELS